MTQALTNVLLMDAVVACLDTQKPIIAASKLAHLDKIRQEGLGVTLVLRLFLKWKHTSHINYGAWWCSGSHCCLMARRSKVWFWAGAEFFFALCQLGWAPATPLPPSTSSGTLKYELTYVIMVIIYSGYYGRHVINKSQLYLSSLVILSFAFLTSLCLSPPSAHDGAWNYLRDSKTQDQSITGPCWTSDSTRDAIHTRYSGV